MRVPNTYGEATRRWGAAYPREAVGVEGGQTGGRWKYDDIEEVWAASVHSAMMLALNGIESRAPGVWTEL